MEQYILASVNKYSHLLRLTLFEVILRELMTCIKVILLQGCKPSNQDTGKPLHSPALQYILWGQEEKTGHVSDSAKLVTLERIKWFQQCASQESALVCDRAVRNFWGLSPYIVILKVSFLGQTIKELFKELWEMGIGRQDKTTSGGYLKTRTVYQLIKRSKP